MKRKLVALMLACMLLLAAVACQKAADEKGEDSSFAKVNEEQNTSSSATSKEVLNIAVNRDLVNPVWYTGNSSTDYYYYNMFMEPLFVFTKEGNIEPYLLESYEEDKDNLRYILKLKQGILFHDGTELTAEDCKFSLDKYKDEGNLKSSAMSRVADIEVLDTYTVAINLTEWDSVLLYQLARFPGYMASKTAYETLGHDGFAAAPVGTGPYKFISREFESNVHFEKFEEYWQGEPIIDEVNVVVMAEDAIAMAALESGEIDAFFPSSTQTADILEGEGFNIVIAAVPSEVYTNSFMMSNPDDPLNDVRVRMAVSYAINPEEVAKAGWGKYAVPATQYAMPGSAMYTEEVTGQPYDPEKAKQLLAEAGYPDGFDTVINVTFYGGPTDPSALAQQNIQAQLAKVGINATINVFDMGQWTNVCNDWGTGMFVNQTTYPNGTASIICMNYRQGLTNVLGTDAYVISDKLNETVNTAMSSTGAEAAELFKQAQKIIFEEDCMLKATCFIYNTSALNPALKNSGIGAVSHRVPGAWTLWNAYFE